MELLWADLDARSADLRSDESLLSPAERRRAGRFRLARDRGRYVAARATLRRLLGARVARDPAALTIATGPFGKPRLADDPDLRFSASHAGRHALFALARERELGIDVEPLRPLPELESVAATTFSPSELRAWIALPAESRLRAFYAAWTRKEAVLKAIGVGLQVEPARVEVSFSPHEPARLLQLDGREQDARRWELHALAIDEAHAAALAAERRNPS